MNRLFVPFGRAWAPGNTNSMHQIFSNVGTCTGFILTVLFCSFLTLKVFNLLSLDHGVLCGYVESKVLCHTLHHLTLGLLLLCHFCRLSTLVLYSIRPT